jgi:hypothetical protein
VISSECMDRSGDSYELFEGLGVECRRPIEECLI